MFRFARMSNATRRRSPFEITPHRLPGQSVEERIRFLRSKWENSLALPLCLAALALYEWWRWLFSIPSNPPLLTIVAGVAILYTWLMRRAYQAESKSLPLAQDGECTVGEMLELLREKGYRILHALIGRVSVQTMSLLVRPAFLLLRRKHAVSPSVSMRTSSMTTMPSGLRTSTHSTNR